MDTQLLKKLKQFVIFSSYCLPSSQQNAIGSYTSLDESNSDFHILFVKTVFCILFFNNTISKTILHTFEAEIL
jgi:hypothetical protein